jgi:hypothetical protein
MIDPSHPNHAVLSHHSGQHLQDLLPTHPPAFNQTDHHPYMLDHRPVAPGRVIRLRSGASPRRFAFVVLDGLLDPASLPAVILDTPLRGLSFAVGFLAAKGTAQILPTGVAGMGEKENPAMPAPVQASSQNGLGPQNRPQEPIIFQHQGGYRTAAIPVRPKLKMLPDPDCKKPKLSLKMLMKYWTSSSYRIATKVSRR